LRLHLRNVGRAMYRPPYSIMDGRDETRLGVERVGR
jgi:hypothetical protein